MKTLDYTREEIVMDLNKPYCVYTQQGVLIAKTVTRSRARQIADKYKGYVQVETKEAAR